MAVPPPLNANARHTLALAFVACSDAALLRADALKPAFPERRIGEIDVGYGYNLANRTVSVGEIGLKMPRASAKAKLDLGTRNGLALCGRLRAQVKVASKTPGAGASSVHTHIATVEERLSEIAI